MNKTEVLICECSSVEHQIVFTYCSEEREDITGIEGAIYEDCMDVSIHLTEYNGFFKRIWVAIKYIFGYRSRYGDWDTFLMNPEDADRLIPYLEKLRDNNKLVMEKLKERDQNLKRISNDTLEPGD